LVCRAAKFFEFVNKSKQINRFSRATIFLEFNNNARDLVHETCDSRCDKKPSCLQVAVSISLCLNFRESWSRKWSHQKQISGQDSCDLRKSWKLWYWSYWQEKVCWLLRCSEKCQTNTSRVRNQSRPPWLEYFTTTVRPPSPFLSNFLPKGQGSHVPLPSQKIYRKRTSRTNGGNRTVKFARTSSPPATPQHKHVHALYWTKWRNVHQWGAKSQPNRGTCSSSACERALYKVNCCDLLFQVLGPIWPDCWPIRLCDP
jgi:hypothetical protein